MDYELARQLKEVGFLQPTSPYDTSPGRPVYKSGSDYPPSEEWAYAPTLSELIEACGGRVNLVIDSEDLDGPDYVRATVPPGVSAKGATYEEALGKLWLALNKK